MNEGIYYRMSYSNFRGTFYSDQAFDFVIEYFENCVDNYNQSIQNLSYDVMIEFLDNGYPNVAYEDSALKAIQLWVNKDTENM